MTTQDTHTGPAVHYYVLTSNPEFKSVVYWLHDHNVTLDIHLNRTRFSIDTASRLHTEFCLRWSHACAIVDDTVDLATGLSLDYSVEHIS
jgi:hypothetical protein